MKRNPRKLKWTKAFRKSAGKEMVVDSTLTFAARRNVPIRYNRDLVATTLKAMQRVSEIRERVFYKKRIEGNKEKERAANRKLVAENEYLLPKVRGSERLALEKERMDGEIDKEIPLPVEKAKVFGKQKMRRKVLVDGGIEDEMEVG
jgi:large subunit ribosomal protein L24e